MNKLISGFLIGLMCLSLCSCSLTDTTPIIIPDSEVSTAVTPSGSGIAENPSKELLPVIVTNDTVPPHEGMVRSKLTNEWIDSEVAALRPIAIMIPNEAGAIPQYRLSDASILYEANVEGRMTRIMALYEDWTKLGKTGNVRSLRTYFAYWAFEWDAFIIHIGGPFYINDLISNPTTQHLDESVYLDSCAFFRTKDKKAPHNAYVTGAGIYDAIKKEDYSLTDRGLAEESHFQFATKYDPNSLVQYGDTVQSATYIDLSGCYPLTRCYFNYNEADGQYYRFQHLSSKEDGPHMDGATGEQLHFKNLIIQFVTYEEAEGGYLTFQCHDTTQTGWFFTNGRGIPISWEKTSDYGATRYYDEAGNEITLNSGKTMICIVKKGDNFLFR